MRATHDEHGVRAGPFAPAGRRDFLRAAGIGGLALALPSLLQGCSDTTAPPVGLSDDSEVLFHIYSNIPATPVTIDLSTDIGIANYAYALEQLEAQFYFFADEFARGALSAEEMRVIRDIRLHEQIHSDFLRALLGSAAIPMIKTDFSTVVFSSRASVLGTAQVFEDLGVAAYNGAGQLLESPEFLLLAGKIVSVEARHAAAIRDLLQPNSRFFAGDDVVDANGLDRAFDPATVLAAAAPFIVNPITVVGG
jgi:hypothetical protein